MASVYFADIRGLSTDAAALPLSEYRVKKLEKVFNAAKRRQNIGAELLLILALRECDADTELPLRIVKDANGKPELRGIGTRFNLSHSGDYAACALSDGAVGIDIQRAEEYRAKLAKRFFTQEEFCSIEESADCDYSFTRLWTLKESYIKYLGTGLRRPLNSFEVLFNGAGKPFVCDDSRCRLWHWTANDYHIALCASADEEKVSLKRINIDSMRW